jgi:hypothetical protein
VTTKRIRSAFLSPAARGSLMFLAGIGLTIKEALEHGPERPSLYVLFAGMMGLPIVWGNGDRFRRDAADEDGDR